jgi:abhydrolase domain-containing protein 6
LTEYLPSISAKTLVVWGDHDQTLAPASFTNLVKAMPHAQGLTVNAGHVPHQSSAKEFNEMALAFLRELG